MKSWGLLKVKYITKVTFSRRSVSCCWISQSKCRNGFSITLSMKWIQLLCLWNQFN